ncbi:IclR family transcriptional regulator [Halalkalicoccus jeotgali]|uniref:ArcR family transcription regulator n=1 Tax=Halalkalicoccus jeotgali (strain DSM 18796 / CECT 7217 / JCM 14584 / KCTC 4019 / B3) TaxID=795797 RepID=D8JBZ0_HALJB|nr:IclR family transcriptional regulator [Halalkalicoccus jeotgali]ADJ16897.1 ArcR family transcription regulator [Halalkalicoccus jeotgali B3]ELY38666.1 ArcR family transcription regulator [Halalkalicoccus jeotgali B3]
MINERGSDRTIQSLKTGFKIIELLRDQDGGYLTDVSTQLDIPKSTAYQYLDTLEEIGYLVKEDSKYELSLNFVSLGEYARTRKEAYTLAKPMVQQLADKTGERAQFLIEEHGRGIYLYTDQGSQGVQTDRWIGEQRYLHSSAGGKAILAYSETRRVKKIIDQIGLPAETQNTITESEKLFRELEEITERGYSINNEESIDGLRGIGVPVIGPDDMIFGAFSISGPIQRFSGDWFQEELPDLLLGTANELELRLKYL